VDIEQKKPTAPLKIDASGKRFVYVDGVWWMMKRIPVTQYLRPHGKRDSAGMGKHPYMTNQKYLQDLLALAKQRHGENSPVTQWVEKELMRHRTTGTKGIEERMSGISRCECAKEWDFEARAGRINRAF
jgi:hypothetical protein